MHFVSRVVKATGLKPVGLVPPQVQILHEVPYSLSRVVKAVDSKSTP